MLSTLPGRLSPIRWSAGRSRDDRPESSDPGNQAIGLNVPCRMEHLHPALRLRPETPIFLHFLSTALADALGYPSLVHPQSLDALSAILCATTCSVYVPYSFVWHLSPRSLISKVLKVLYDSAQLDLLTLHTDVDAFIKARLTAFRHDKEEQALFKRNRRTAIIKLFDAPVLKIHPTTEIIKENLDSWSRALVEMGNPLGDLVQSSLANRTEEGLTRSFFLQNQSLSFANEITRILALEIERQFVRVYLSEFDGVIMTGLRRCDTIDPVSTYCPQYDLRILRQILEAVLRPNIFKDPANYVEAAADLRGCEEQLQFVACVLYLLSEVFTDYTKRDNLSSRSVQEIRQRASGELRFWVPRAKEKRTDKFSAKSYALAASRLSESLLSIRRYTRSEGSTITSRYEDKIMPRKSPKIFVSYCRDDNDSADSSRRWLDRLLKALRPLEKEEALFLWSDRILSMGTAWKEELENALDSAKVAILLVSPAFLSSNFIRETELPRLLARYEQGKVVIIPVILRPCLFEETIFRFPDPVVGPHKLSLGDLQSANPPSRPLNALGESEQDEVFLSIARRVLKLVSS